MGDRDSGVKRSRWWCAAVAFGVAAFFLTLATPAPAATLGSSFSTISYNAAAAEVNQLTVSRSGTDYLFAETGVVTITPTLPCSSVSASVASCPAAGIRTLNAFLGDQADKGTIEASIAPPITSISILGDVGNDTLTSNSTISGTTMSGNEGDDTITGNAAHDDVRAGDGSDIVNTGGGDDYVDEGGGSDIINTGPGRDRITYEDEASGADLLDGGPGYGDSVDARNRSNPLNININGVADDGEAGEGDNLIGIEQVDTGTGDDTVTTGAGPDSIQSGDGDDVLNGGPGPDYTYGGNGDDVVSGGDGGDTINGGDGADVMDGGGGDDDFSGEMFDEGADRYVGGPGIDTISGIGDFLGRAVTVDLDGVADDGPIVPVDDTPLDNAGADIENLSVDVPGEGMEQDFAFADDNLTGNDSANQIDGGAGDDRIDGLGGPDALLGGPGQDRLDGGQGIDELDGAGGADNIRSRDSSPDEVSCGSSSDILLADSLDDFTVTCDQSSTGARLKTKSAKVKKNKALLKVICPAAEGIDCKVKITAKKGKKTLAKGSGKVKSAKTGKVKLKLTKAGKKARSRKLTLRAKTVLTDATGAKVATTRPKLVLRR